MWRCFIQPLDPKNADRNLGEKLKVSFFAAFTPWTSRFAPWASPRLTLQSWLKAKVSCWSSSRSFRQKLRHTVWPWCVITTASTDTGKKHILRLPKLLLYLLYQFALSSLWHCILLHQVSHMLDSRHCRKLKRIRVPSEDFSILYSWI